MKQGDTLTNNWIYLAFSCALSIWIYEGQHTLSFLLSLAYLAFLYVRCSRKILFLCIGAFLLSGLYYDYMDRTNATTLFDNQREFEGVISSPPSINGDSLRFQFSILDEHVTAIYKLSTEAEKQAMASLEVGMSCLLKGELKVPEAARNVNAFDYKQYLYYHRIHWVLHISDMELSTCKNNSKTAREHLLTWRQKGIQYIHHTFGEPIAPFMQALLYGERKEMNEDVTKSYQQLGVIHLLAISGLHVGFLVAAVFYALIRVGLTREHATILIICLLPIYVLLAGAAPSVIRAALMTMFILFSLRVKSKLRPLDALSLAFIFMLLINPYYLFQVGFQLSFTVSFFLIVSNPFIIQKREMVISQLFIVSFIAQIGSLPLILYHFYEVSLLSLPLNMMFVPLFSILILPLCFLTVIFTICLPSIGGIIEWILHVLLIISMELASFFSSISTFQLIVGKLSIWGLLCLYASSCYLLYKMEKKSNAKSFLVAIGIFLLCVIVQMVLPYLHPFGRVTMIDVGQGDSILIELPFRKSVYLIDAGGTVPFDKEAWREKKKSFEVGEDVITPYLKSRGINKIDKFIITHGDYDHAGGAFTLLDEFTIDELVIGKKKQIEGVEQAIVKKAIERNIAITVVQEGDKWEVGGYRFHVVAPYGNESSKNDGSVVLFTKLGRYTWLFTGDLEQEGEEKLIKEHPMMKVDVLKVGHHGSKSSTTEQFIQHVNPKISFISVGKTNRYHHPHPDVLRTLKNHHIFIFRTDQDGMVTYTFSSNNGTFTKTLP
ncbi:DNA internalization-related competence protein ComEC/Rec2 [Bacillus sp. CGMCC 1.16541]|uniref:DNA internalization-related competence protein ComEC/Rec2 n=1 Tax=Bacillus sp. CGMCC 1.16541 TaxID=2185143 RepID=UPI000D73201D|nr:DNA internalization-related competence protein ComEC/Rec2 [Bacillus sp. CGMCC 1.16541]